MWKWINEETEFKMTNWKIVWSRRIDFNRNTGKPVLKKEQSALQYWMRTGFCKIDLRVIVYKLNMGQQLLLLQKRQT